MAGIDLLKAINKVSDVVHNRPRPLREFDQIYMKTGDLVAQSEVVAGWGHGKRLAFIGDGDAVSVCVAYLRDPEMFDFGPSKVTVFDFDQRIVNAVKRFAEKQRIDGILDAVWYNVLDPFPDPGKYDCFYTNPPWGEHNGGESVNIFAQRGFEATGYQGEGLLVIADDDELPWAQQVLANAQRFAAARGFRVSQLQPKRHRYHLDVEILSCNLFLRAVPGNAAPSEPAGAIAPERLENFYGLYQPPKVGRIREVGRPDYGKAFDAEYELEYLEERS
jgi:N4-bis(aminopropyl)spermidine synthase